MSNLSEVDIQKEYLPNPNPWVMLFKIPGKEITVTFFPPKDFRTTPEDLTLLARYFLQGEIPKKATNE